ncbi:hypothetical protein [uncultured Erythrobacter sp.]|uniref:hypothetical protein n=1 Tax=uncultured Erythrobacter sp. TaxID=263913 RepID=UPI002601BE53|nr:hypothetical protein [uncultured Erythrobacter sp.]
MTSAMIAVLGAAAMQVSAGGWVIGSEGTIHCMTAHMTPKAQDEGYDVKVGILLWPDGRVEVRKNFYPSDGLYQNAARVSGVKLMGSDGAMIARHNLAVSEKLLDSPTRSALILSPANSAGEQRARFTNELSRTRTMVLVDSDDGEIESISMPDASGAVSSLNTCIASLGSGEAYRHFVSTD